MIALVSAIAEDGTIGDKGGIPWNHPADRRHFRRLTMGCQVIMGRRTWESLPRPPLPGRYAHVLGRNFTRPAEGATHWFHWSHFALRSALFEAGEQTRAWRRSDGIDRPIWIIGGVRLYDEALPLADKVYLTRVPGRPDGDTKWVPNLAGFRLKETREEAGLRFEEWVR